MLMRNVRWCAALCGFLTAAAVAMGEPGAVKESARQIPVAYQVDVVVVGGSTGAVSAALAAANQGASVFLAAPRPYLGEDMCASLRLWLEPGEQPVTNLARAIFNDSGRETPISSKMPLNALKFNYTSDRDASGRHQDTKPPSKLFSGVIGQPEKNSVQYDGDVTLTADLGAAQGVGEARLVLYDKGGSDFRPGGVTVSTGADGKTWKPIGNYKPGDPGADQVVTIAAPVGAETRFVRYEVKKAEGSKRLLLGQIVILSDKPEPTKNTAPPSTAVTAGPPRPMHVKKTLDDALLAAKVQYLYGCYATELLRDAQGQPCGIVMANRAGRQAVLAKVIVDASDRAIVARMAGAKFTSFPAGEQKFCWTVVGGEIKNDAGMASKVMGHGFGDPRRRGEADDGGFDLVQYTMPIPMPDASWSAFARAEQVSRDRSWGDKGEINTDEMFQVPPDSMTGAAGAPAEWKSAADVDLRATQPAGTQRLYVLGGCADVSRDAVAKLLRPCALMELGERIGGAAAADAKALGAPQAEHASVAPIAAAPAPASPAGEVKEILENVRPSVKSARMIQSPDRSLPILGEYDVVVVGGGTGGAPAAISASRAKAKTLCIEYLHGLGGVGTQGLVTKYYWGYRGGFTAEVPSDKSGWDPWEKAEWLRKEIRKTGGDVWFGVLGCGAFVQDGSVRGVVVATPTGRGVVLAKVVIDSTGNSDVAAAAGAQTTYTNADELAVQGTGLPSMKLSASYNNTDFTVVDETDMMDVWHVLVYSKSKYPNAFDMGQLLDTRERRRIVGDFTMTLPDQVNKRTYPDTISVSYSNFDTHGYTVDPYLLVEHPEKKGLTVNIPYRCLLPRGLDQILVTGLGISVHRDAVPMTRMQPDIQNQGYSAGLIAANCARNDLSTRSVDIRAIQQELVKKGIIPERCLTDQDSYPLPAEQIAEAVKSAANGEGMAVIITHPEQSLPLLHKAYENAAKPEEKLAYAKILAVLGDAAGLETLIHAVEAMSWDKGWNYRGGGQYGRSLSPLDTMIVAMGRTHDKRALPAILSKVAQLDDTKEFSHHRAVALACESIGDPSAAAPLAALLKKPGMTGYVHSNVEIARKLSGSSASDVSTRDTSIRELSLARALFRCGDVNGEGQKILQQYAQDLRGHFARHAQAVLDERKQK